MRTTFDRIRQAVSFEVVGLVIVTPLFAWIFDHPFSEIGIMALIGATAATAWNYIYNLGFDHALTRWRGNAHKTLVLRILHALGFEASLLVLLLPVFAWWLDISLIEALLIDLAFAAFFMVYTFIFTWVYDTLFPPLTPPQEAG